MSQGSEVTEASVREEVRAWLDEHWDPNRSLREWRELLADSGWGLPAWPRQWCGRGLPVGLADAVSDEFRKKGFEIYGVSFDEDRGDWLGAVEQNDMNWLHVSEVKGFDNQAAKDYAIQGIPSNFLIDGQGTIVARNLRGEALYEKISELLAQ